MSNVLERTQFIFLVISFFVASALLCVPSVARASEALLFVAPATATVTVGETFTVAIQLDTGGGIVNAAEGAVSFNPDDLEFISIGTGGSILSWLVEPSLVTRTSSIEFSGSTQGYNGDAGTIMNITFRALRNTNTQVWFSQGAAILAADGKGSNVLSQLRSGTYTLSARSVTPSLAASVGQSLNGLLPANVSGSGASNIITSITHADQDRWYATSTATLKWNLPESVVGMRTLLNDSPKTPPTKEYTKPISQISIRDLDEGTSYFHLQLRDGEGWGDIYHYALNIDTEKPTNLTVKEEERVDETDPNIAFKVHAEDEGSGVEHYEFSIDSGKPIVWGDTDGSGIFSPDNIRPGEHTVTISAHDKAGNKVSEGLTFTIDALDAPVITSAPDSLLVGDVLTIRGETYPNADIDAFVSHDGNEASVRTITSDATGAFIITAADPARSGMYEVWFEVTDRRGARSNASVRTEVQVSQPTLVLFGNVAVSYLSLLVPLIAALVGLGILVWAGFFLYRRMTGRVGVETKEAQEVVHQSFSELKTDIRKHIKMLLHAESTRSLTPEEEHMLAELVQHFDETEEELVQEIQDIQETAHIRPNEQLTNQPLKIQRVK